MLIIMLLVCASVVLALCFLFAFLWCVRSGQLDDMHTPAMRIFSDGTIEKNTKNSP